MSDIFKMIKGMSNTEREPRRKNSLRNEIDKLNNDFDVNIGEVKMSNPNLVEFVPLNIQELDSMPDKKKIITLTREYLALVDRFTTVDEKAKKSSKELSSVGISLHQKEKETEELKELIRNVGRLLPEGIELKRTLEQLNWSVKDIHDIFITKIQELIDRAVKSDHYAEEKMKDTIVENTQLKKLIIYTENERNKIQEAYNDLVSKFENGDAITLEEVSKQTAPNNSFENTSSPSKEESVEQVINEVPSTNNDENTSISSSFSQFEDDGVEIEVDSHVLFDVEKHLDLLNDSKKYILETIGRTGFCRSNEIKAFFEKDEKGKFFFQRGTKFLNQDLTTAIKNLKDSGYLSSTKVELGSRGAYNFSVFELSELGSSLFKVITKRNPKEPEFKKILAQHKSLEHGYLIKESAAEFSAKGYKVYEDRKDLRFDLPDGKRKDFDLVVEKDGETLYLEVERGTHTDEGFFDAMDKIYQVMQNKNISPVPFHFISPKSDILNNKTKRQFFLWIKKRHGGFSEVKGKIIVNFITFDTLKKDGNIIWETKKF